MYGVLETIELRLGAILGGLKPIKNNLKIIVEGTIVNLHGEYIMWKGTGE